MHLLSKYSFSLLLFFFATQTYAGCILPVPDGGENTPSQANLEGKIVAIKNNIVTIHIKNTKNKVSVIVPKNQTIYTAFGGDLEAKGASGLLIGQKSWVWFIGCKGNGKKTPVSAYFQIFSTDPNDQP